MDPNANPVPAVPQPIQDVLPPRDTLGNPENLAGPVATPPPAQHVNRSSAPIPSHNPIAGTALAQSQALHDSVVDDHALDGVLKDVTDNIRANSSAPMRPKSAKRGLFGFLKRNPKPKLSVSPSSPRSPIHLPPTHPTQPVPRQQANALVPNESAKSQLKSGPTALKKRGKINLPAVAAVVIALILVAVALSAFKS